MRAAEQAEVCGGGELTTLRAGMGVPQRCRPHGFIAHYGTASRLRPAAELRGAGRSAEGGQPQKAKVTASDGSVCRHVDQ